MKQFIIIGFIAAIIVSSCKQNITLDLKNSAPQIVIEGIINDQPGQYFVAISKSIPYYDSNKVVPVSAAVVVVSDDAGTVDTFKEAALAGRYLSSSIMGTPGRTYHMSVNIAGQQYDAISKMPPPVPVDSIFVQSFSLGSLRLVQPTVMYQDPIGAGNYYRTRLYLNGIPQSKITLDDDKMTDGKIKSTRVRTDNDIHTGDTLKAELQCIDQPVWNYYNTLNTSTLSSVSAAPANPVSNISNKALGYFTAYSSKYSKQIIF